MLISHLHFINEFLKLNIITSMYDGNWERLKIVNKYDFFILYRILTPHFKTRKGKRVLKVTQKQKQL